MIFWNVDVPGINQADEPVTRAFSCNFISSLLRGSLKLIIIQLNSLRFNSIQFRESYIWWVEHLQLLIGMGHCNIRLKNNEVVTICTNEINQNAVTIFDDLPVWMTSCIILESSKNDGKLHLNYSIENDSLQCSLSSWDLTSGIFVIRLFLTRIKNLLK